MSQDQSTKLLLQIKDKNITHLHVSDTKRDALRVYGTLSYKLNVCPYCANDRSFVMAIKQHMLDCQTLAGTPLF